MLMLYLNILSCIHVIFLCMFWVIISSPIEYIFSCYTSKVSILHIIKKMKNANDPCVSGQSELSSLIFVKNVYI